MLRRAREIDPDDPKVYHRLANLYSARGAWSKLSYCSISLPG